MGLTKAKLFNTSVSPEQFVPVLFNPTEYSIDRGASYAEIQTPGSDLPIVQFIRGEAETLSLELFLDATNQREPIEKTLADLRQFVKIHPKLHAPPVCRFQWGEPPAARATVSDPRVKDDSTFTGVVTSFKEKYTLFDEDGRVLRARVSVTFKSYRAAEVQTRETARESPDRSRVRVLREGESLTQIANEAYGDPRLWRLIAKANGVERPRFIAPGTSLLIPSAGTGVTRALGGS